MKTLTHCLIAAAAAAASFGASAGNYCGELKNHYGPFDFRMRGQVNLEIVEENHLTENVLKGDSHGATGELSKDLDYTLRAIPNHPLALKTIDWVSKRDKTVQLPGANFPTECYFVRAIRFAPDDAAVRAVYGNFLSTRGRAAEALTMYNEAVRLDPENATYNYNLGLSFVKMKQFHKAVPYAQKAYALGFPLPGLRNQLKAAGKWEEAPSK